MHGLLLALSLVVRVVDLANTPSARLAVALDTARDSFDAAGVGVEWVVCPSSNALGCGEPAGAGALIVRIVNTPAHAPEPDSLGYSWVDRDARRGTLATVLSDRVTALAAAAHVDASPLLGHVIAHELGHLLLGSTTHSRTGLMRARWTVTELRQNMLREWMFSRAETALLHDSLAVAAANN
jgi:hypothetical protein